MEKIIINGEREFIKSLEEIKNEIDKTFPEELKPATYYAQLAGALQAHYQLLYEYIKRLSTPKPITEEGEDYRY